MSSYMVAMDESSVYIMYHKSSVVSVCVVYKWSIYEAYTSVLIAVVSQVQMT